MLTYGSGYPSRKKRVGAIHESPADIIPQRISILAFQTYSHYTVIKLQQGGITMILYHGSNTGDIQVLEPRQADHDRPYIYMSTLEVVAAFYLCNRVERPYYWFPYGFDKGTGVAV